MNSLASVLVDLLPLDGSQGCEEPVNSGSGRCGLLVRPSEARLSIRSYGVVLCSGCRWARTGPDTEPCEEGPAFRTPDTTWPAGYSPSADRDGGRF